ncbi:MAG TPA: hypothetical protein ENI87_06770, partial [bacterium]|nr:hypothetical protein [bacterium]
MRAIPIHLSLALFSALAAGCWDRGRTVEPLQVDRTSPVLGDPARPVLLNDALTVYFSAPIHPLSVTEDSVTVLDEDGNLVPGELRVGSNWVAFHPEVPLSAELLDGSFRPGGHYHLQLAGHPRPDSIRSRDGRWLEQVVAFDVFVATRDRAPAGLPSILRPPTSELPFFLRGSEVPLPVAADAPRLPLHFSLPVLPTTVRPEAFVVRLLQEPVVELRPRAVRVQNSPLDAYPGSTVELELGALPQQVSGGQRALVAGDWLSVELRPDSGLCDYGGQP